MQKTDAVIFDLDGTLWDTSASCAIAWNTVIHRREIQFREITADDVRKVTGKPHDVCIKETFQGLSELQIRQLVLDTQTEDNLAVERYGGHLYEGVETGLSELRKHYPLFIVSNCQSGYIETFFGFSGLSELFLDHECWGNTGKLKPENLALLIERNSLKNPVYVGDAEGDREAARNCGIPFYFAEYGFGKVLENDFSFTSFSQLVAFLRTQ